uniref:ABC-type amino acid transport/signal transduction systems, periplasmic component n=1 Tax=Thiohalobacter thiocyanaticus TaxID=585455 RepID=A0A1Z4VMT0_9GAMM|nr:hypothetical protein [Thiohalobacter thiocyanaticus]BAZ92929.1 ABC-type amino acid transport/signal transduction systems, periplasmic component [Thiohalobacter thiocyanaticus]
MKRTTIAASVLGMILSGSALVASADHNSPWGEGWATDMMDVHDARLDTMDDDTVTGNEFLADSLVSAGGGSRPDTAGGGMGAGMGGGMQGGR